MSNERIVDLRSDTVTKPTQEMREEMMNAEVGDDVMREDPTVKKLEELAADKLGKEDAMVVTSGTQGNLSSLLTHTNKGEEIILEKYSHIYNYEVGGFAEFGGLSVRPIFGENGFMDPMDIKQVIRGKDIHYADQSLISLENTHNSWGGVPIDADYIETIGDMARKNDLKIHIDGARLFNASVSLDENVENLVEPADSVQICLSKGLSAPIGSLVVGSEKFIEKARKTRKKLGGGMRQSGVIAAPGIVALEKMIGRLEEDHKNARKLTEGIKDLGIEIEPEDYQTNIVFFDTSTIDMTAEMFKNKLKENGIKCLALGEYEVRLVTHREIDSGDIEYTIKTIERILKEEKRI